MLPMDEIEQNWNSVGDDVRRVRITGHLTQPPSGRRDMHQVGNSLDKNTFVSSS
jgi:hypothetical protein